MSSLPVPGTRREWTTLAQQHNVPSVQLLSGYSALPSGSKFTMEHYLPLRILFISEKAFSEKNRKLYRARYLRPDIREKVSATMKKDKSLQAIQVLLKRSTDIKTQWNAQQYRAVGPFGNGLEKLYQIVSRRSRSGTEPEDPSEDTTNLKIFASSPSAPSPPSLNPRLTTAFQNMDMNRGPATPPPRGHLARNQKKADYTEVGDDSQLFESPGTEVSSAPGTDKRLAQLDFERTALVLSDEQTVNMCLENLLMALSNVMGSYGRLLSDRRAFVVPKDSSSDLYQACVDGLIMAPNRQDVMAFIEVKRSLRSTHDSIYRQLGAQMAAFIRTHEHSINQQRSQEERSMWMVSMEGYQAFIVVAFYDQAYVDYLSSKPGSERYTGFLKMITSRPYDLRLWENGMESFFRDVATLMGGPK